MARRGRGIFWFGAHCYPVEGHSAPTRWSIAPLIQTGSDRARGTFALSVITTGGWRSPVLDLQTLRLHGLEQGLAQRILAKSPQIVVEIAHAWHEITTGNSQRFQLVTKLE